MVVLVEVVPVGGGGGEGIEKCKGCELASAVKINKRNNLIRRHIFRLSWRRRI